MADYSQPRAGLMAVPLRALVECPGVASVDLQDNVISDIPADIDELRGTLRHLNLKKNKFTTIPASLGQLVHLQTLNMANNEITDIPQELGSLVELTVLNLSFNKIASLSDVVLRLHALVTLDLTANRIAQLPADIAQLQALEELILDQNALTSLPAAIGRLTTLRILSARHNRLTDLPAEFQRLACLSHCNLEGNPLPAALASVVDVGPAATRSFLHDRQLQASISVSNHRQLSISVVRAQLTQTAGKAPDMFVEIEAGGPFKLTPVVRGSWAPVWPEAFPFTFVVTRTTTVRFRLVRKQLLRDATIGTAELAAAGIPATATGGREMDASLELWSTNRQASHVCGTLVVKVSLAGQPFLDHLQARVPPSMPAASASPPPRPASAPTWASPGTAAAAGPTPRPAQPARAAAVLPLPPGWEERVAPDGRTFYVDHTTRRTQWQRPEPSLDDFVQLPEGWEARQTPQGRTYYVNHHTQTTTWQRPTAASLAEMARFQAAQARMPSLMAQHGRRTLLGDAPARPDEAPLPADWEQRFTPSGRAYYVCHSTQTTQWEDPRTQGKIAADVSMLPLPLGWEQRTMPDGRIFFVDHNTKNTTFQDPRVALLGKEASPQYSRDFRFKLWAFRQTHCKLLPGTTHVKVSRDNIFPEAFQAIMAFVPRSSGIVEDLKCRIFFTFLGEQGLDYGGVTREFFFLISHAMLNPMYCLFQYASNNYALQINPSSAVNPEHLLYFRFIGRIIALAIFLSKFLDSSFTIVFYKQLLGKAVGLKDLELVDTEFYNSLKWIMDNSIDDCGLGLTFSTTCDRFGELEEIDLKPGGKQIEVTDANKAEYIKLVTDWRLVRSVAAQMDAVRKGFHEIIPLQYIRSFDEHELELLLIGLAEFSMGDWEQATVYRNYDASSTQIKWFWEVLRAWDNEKRARLLQFVTGSCRLPVGGFKELIGSSGTVQPFCVERYGDHTMLPRSHTCFNRLDLPPYLTKRELESKLTLAITETEGFGIE
eukprot:m.151338 g.151338  ORF g.151338 m.151338 type:complete len:996 (+) comp9757_c0_seq3:57-3044(+)